MASLDGSGARPVVCRNHTHRREIRMKRAAMTLAVSLAISMVVVACASMQPGSRDLVARAVLAGETPARLASDMP